MAVLNASNAAKVIRRTQRKLAKEIRQYAELGEKQALVGLPNDRIHDPSGLPLSELGAIHEFGTDKVPERSFLRGFLRKASSDIDKQLSDTASAVASGTAPMKALESLALWAEGGVKDYIANGKANFEPLAASTIAKRRKGSDNPLNDTGALRQGIIGIVE